MTATILNFRLRQVSREQAMQWLILNNVTFPKSMNDFLGANLFHGWRFINADGCIYFADCISRGISESDYETHKIMRVMI